MSFRKAAIAILAGGIALAAPVNAEIRRLIIDQREALRSESSLGIPEYQMVRGRLIGEVDPHHPQNAIIQDITLAPKTARARVEYIATFTLLLPTRIEDANGVLLYEVANRGRRLTAFGPDEAALRFLRSRGYAVLWSGWQGDLAERPTAQMSAATLQLESANVPRAKPADGSFLSGPYMIRAPTLGGPGPSGKTMPLDQGRAGALAYFPATFTTDGATLASESPGMANGSAHVYKRHVIELSDWMWWNCTGSSSASTVRTPAELCLRRGKGDFDPERSYTLTFTARDPLVLGLGLAAVRDATSFFHHATTDAEGTSNPLAGRIHHVIGQGVSQAGNFVKTFIRLGFNADERGRRVWDAVSVHIAARLIPINYRFATPGSSASLYMPGSEGVLWWGDAAHRDRPEEPVSLLDRCRRSKSCPRVMETFGGAELWNQRMTSGLVTADLQQDIPLPPNVRRYFFPSTSHGGGAGGFSLDAVRAADRWSCELPLNPNPQDAQMRALLVALTDWVKDDVLPPPSRYPTLGRGELVRDAFDTLKTPSWGDAPDPHGIANPLLVYDYGPGFDHMEMSGVMSRMPPPIRAVIPALVPKMDSDGNEVGGVRSVQLMAPLGSYLSWNVFREGPYAGQICSYHGGFIPFANTRAERLANGDERPSLEERYGSRERYLTAIRTATDQALHERFLLPEDAVLLLQQAQRDVFHDALTFRSE